MAQQYLHDGMSLASTHRCHVNNKHRMTVSHKSYGNVSINHGGCLLYDMMTSSNGNIFRVTGPLCGEFTGPGEIPAQRPVTRSFDVFFDLRLIDDWVNNREAGDLRRHRGHYDVNQWTISFPLRSCTSMHWLNQLWVQVMGEWLHSYQTTLCNYSSIP